ncbi:hypothetical protein EMPS_09975 [Entomortierella parvispora]|uniref:Uncharacterized protein n=1 Tax=Entomortierella parvispora TaxID=205924 RepID=A0A9P3HJ68_9FUNG|nr:hypothetical protein EMPS_09975 [Entomortierella parvispora]
MHSKFSVEWAEWMKYLKTSKYAHVQRRAVAASTLTVDDIFKFYKDRVLDNHELGILGETSGQVVNVAHHLGSVLQERHRPPSRTSSINSELLTLPPGENDLDADTSANHAMKNQAVRSKGKAVAGPYTADQTKSALNPDTKKRSGKQTKAVQLTKKRKVANDNLKAARLDLHTESRKRRYDLLDKDRFWRLSSGRAVETVLFQASIQHGATASICSYVVDVTCRTTKALFRNDEWNEIVAMSHFELPQIPRPTLLFLEKLRKSIVSGVHPNYVPLPDPNTMDAKDIMDCILAQKTAAEWYFLYHKEPSPFTIDDLSEAWWARESWAALHDFLHDLPSIFMVDGEKRGLDSSRRRNMGRQYNPEEPARKRIGRKLDLICRDEELLHDWMVIERMRHWDPQSTKLLREFWCDVLRETVTIAHNRMFEVPATFRHSCTFFGGYTGDTGFGFLQIHPATESSYVLLLDRQPHYTLPRKIGEMREPFQGLVKLLRIRTATKSTIELYRELLLPQSSPDGDTGQNEEDEENVDLGWMTNDPVEQFDANNVVVSSPLDPDDFPPEFESDPGSASENN